MKKLKLKTQELNSLAVLTRAQLRNVVGGNGSCYNMPGAWIGYCDEAEIAKYCRYGGVCS